MQTFSLSDSKTWATLLGVLAGIIGAIHPGFNVSTFVPAASVLFSGIILAAHIFGGHHYEAAVNSAASTVVQAGAVLPAPIQPMYETRLRQVEATLNSLQTALSTAKIS